MKEVLADGVSSASPDGRLAPFLAAVAPTVILKTVFEKHFIAIEARKACEQLAKGGAHALPEAIDALVEGARQVKYL